MVYWIGDLTSPKQRVLERHPTVYTASGRQDIAAVFITWGRKRLPFIGGIDIRLAHQLPGKTEAGAGTRT